VFSSEVRFSKRSVFRVDFLFGVQKTVKVAARSELRTRAPNPHFPSTRSFPTALHYLSAHDATMKSNRSKEGRKEFSDRKKGIERPYLFLVSAFEYFFPPGQLIKHHIFFTKQKSNPVKCVRAASLRRIQVGAVGGFVCLFVCLLAFFCMRR